MANGSDQPADRRRDGQPILTTKLFVPRAQKSLVARPRLVEQIDEALQGPLTLVSAPAGFGKTTLLAEWHRSDSAQRIPLAWLSLDSDDSDPVRFWTYFVTAIRQVEPDFGQDLLSLLRASQLPPDSILLALLLDELLALGQELALVLDDYHAVDSKAVHDSLAYLVEHLPPELHLVVLTRVDPPWPLARWRVRGTLHELRASDLRFTFEEADAYLREMSRLALSTEEVSALEVRTEGWVVGLQMAALSLRGRSDPARLVHAFSGTNRYVLDFLVEEVLLRQPDAVQSFLLETSILERLSGGLCEAVTGQSGGQAMLERLEKANLFLIPLDDERRWYRYHHLFRDLLRARLDQSRPEVLPALFIRAATWCEAEGLSSEAIGYALASKDYEQAASIAERWYLDMLRRSDLALPRIAELPDEVLRRRPWLAAFRAVLDIVFARLDSARRWLYDAESLETEADAPEIAAFLRLERAYVAALDLGDPDPTEADVIGAAEEVLRLLPEGQAALRNVFRYWQAMGHYLLGNLATADELWRQVVQGDLKTGATNAIAVTVDKLSAIRVVQGRLREAGNVCREWLDRMEERGRWRYYLAGGVSVAFTDVLRERNELGEALRLADQGIEDDRAWQNPLSWSSAYTTKARVLQAMGRSDEAREVMRDLEERLRGFTVQPDVRCEIAACWSKLSLEQGDLPAAAARIDEILADSSGSPSFRFERAWIARARVLLAQRETDEATTLLSQLADAARRGGRTGRLIEILCLQALAFQAQRRAAPALDALRAALELAEPEGYVRVFVDEGEPMRDLLAKLQGHFASAPADFSAGYATRLLAAFAAEGESEITSAGSSTEPSSIGSALSDTLDRPSAAVRSGTGGDLTPLAEPLTPRELEVLRLVAEGRSNRQIADALIVSLNTAKSHVHALTGKLGAASRTEAVARARRLHLLD